MRRYNLRCQQFPCFLQFTRDSGAAVAQEEKAFLQEFLLVILQPLDQNGVVVEFAQDVLQCAAEFNRRLPGSGWQ